MFVKCAFPKTSQVDVMLPQTDGISDIRVFPILFLKLCEFILIRQVLHGWWNLLFVNSNCSMDNADEIFSYP